ncbi:uncharacterized protein KY384_000468 [Bacidia gigantensis]|uniref:uncharacterized protein n=1 Tax=Bacidia gigantensis TaxID=2732470 RepID=UPI001D03A657|nr:uncharacterized protein KY384_000468 [Bacidia gigantensis]KAG8525708.1 hypothetical protein KY384_000468 [Bacidia gigantensis]
MLYYSGHTRRIGNVDDGSTVTDFLPLERARGVTIQSAAISFHWPPLPDASIPNPSSTQTAISDPHNINLIDTPGHADFTFEVLRSLRILDGAVCILDAVAGVEAQTEKVWLQAAKYRIPKLVYVNKLDREGAAFGETVRQIASRLRAWPAVCSIPWWEGGKGAFTGIGDAVSLQAIKWPREGDGTKFEIHSLASLHQSEPRFATEIEKARAALVELLSEHDEGMVNDYLEAGGDPLAISSSKMVTSLRRAVCNLDLNVAPIFAGASFKNIGVQPLLDAVVQLLPYPTEAPDPVVKLGEQQGTLSELLRGELMRTQSVTKSNKSLAHRKQPSAALIQNLEACALAFKVVFDPRRGMLVYVRVYSGSIQRQSVLFNTNLQVSEKAPQLLKMYANEAVQIDAIPAGQIGVITGLKHARTGDTLVAYAGGSQKSGPPAPLNSLQLRPIEVPPAVFFASIEANSPSDEKNKIECLDLLVREDPSLQVTQDEDSGQTLLSGMGGFHLEIAQARLKDDLKAKAKMGNIEIAYREAILSASPADVYVLDREQGGKQARASCIAKVEPLDEDPTAELNFEPDFTTIEDGNRISIKFEATTDESKETEWNRNLPHHLDFQILHESLKNGALAALSRGGNFLFPMHNTHVILTFDPRAHIFGTDTTPAALSAAARNATKAALKATALQHGSAIMELVMHVTVSTDEASLGAVVNDLSSSRGGHVLSLDDGSVASGPAVNEAPGEFPRIDVSKVYVPPDPYGPSQMQEQGIAIDGSRQKSIVARVPLKEMVGYLKHLRSLTGGRGTFVMNPDKFERVVGQREKLLIKDLKGY